MNDLVKLFLDRVLSWPVSVFGICLIFQSSIRMLLKEFTSFIGRASQLSVKHKDTTVEAMADQNPQVKSGAGSSAEFDLGAGTAISTNKTPISEDVALERNAARDYGKGVASVQYRETSIKSELERLGFRLEEQDTVETLIRQLAAQQCVTFFERTYRVIFGSQISAMDFLNTSSPVPASLIEAVFFDTAKNFEQAFYSDFTFTQWLAFMLENMLIAQDGENFGISVQGRDFLVWMVNSGLPHSKPH
jgi:hypothetical protein